MSEVVGYTGNLTFDTSKPDGMPLKKVDTSKTDVIIGRFGVSVKGPKALLMSGEQKESRATVLSAMKSSGVGGKLKQELLDEVDKFVTITRTIGADLTGGELKKMSVDDVKKYKDFDPSNFDFKTLAFRELQKYSKTVLVALASKLAKGVDIKQYRQWGQPGIRAQLLNIRKKALEMDFVIEGDDQSMHILNTVSPGFTCALPFAEYVCDQIDSKLS